MKLNQKHQQSIYVKRAGLWANVYAHVTNENALRGQTLHHPESAADGAVAAFDKRFPMEKFTADDEKPNSKPVKQMSTVVKI